MKLLLGWLVGYISGSSCPGCWAVCVFEKYRSVEENGLVAVAVCLGKRQRLRVMPQQLKVKHDRGLTCQPGERLPAVRGPCLVMLVELQSRLDSAQAGVLPQGQGLDQEEGPDPRGRVGTSGFKSWVPAASGTCWRSYSSVRGQPPPLYPHRTMQEGSALGSNTFPLSNCHLLVVWPSSHDITWPKRYQGLSRERMKLGLARGQKPCNHWNRESLKHHWLVMGLVAKK